MENVPKPEEKAASPRKEQSAGEGAKSPRKEKKEKKKSSGEKKPAVTPIDPPKLRFLRATTDYKGKDDKELSFTKGEMILYKGQDESGYVEGTLNGKTGFFPVGVVEECVAESTINVNSALLRLASPRVNTTSLVGDQKEHTKERLEKELNKRPAKEELVNRNILQQTTSAPALAESQRKVEAQKTKDFLNTFFRQQITNQEPLLTEEAVDDLVLKMLSKEGLPIGKHSKSFASYDGVFVGREAVDWLIANKITEDKLKAIEVMKFLVECKVVEHVPKRKPFFKSSRLYRFHLQEPQPRLLNCDKLWNTTGRDAVDVSVHLLNSMLELMKKFKKDDGGVEWAKLRQSTEFIKWSLTTAELRTVDVNKLSKEAKRAFFVNLYQLIALHVHAKLGIPQTMATRKTLHEGCFYVVCGSEYSLDLIESFILHGDAAHSVMKDDPRNQLQLKLTENPSWLWGLSDGTKSTPPFRAYAPATFDEMANAVAKEFFAAKDRIKLHNDLNEIEFPRLLERYSKIFKVEPRQIAPKLESVMPDAVNKFYQRIAEIGLTDKISVKFAQADHTPAYFV